MGGRVFKFKKNPRYPHNRSEGLTRRGEAQQERLMLGKRAKTMISLLTDFKVLHACTTCGVVFEAQGYNLNYTYGKPRKCPAHG